MPNADTKFAKQALERELAGYTNSGYLLRHLPSDKLINYGNVGLNENLVYRDDYQHKSEVIYHSSIENQRPETSKESEFIFNIIAL